jgi:galactokinase
VSSSPAPAVLDADRLRSRLGELDPAARERSPEIRIVRAPGRVNLIGEHTDYNQGFVLPAAIELETWIAFVPSDDRRVRLTLDDGGETLEVDLDDIGPRRGQWIDYVAGTAWALAAAGVATAGFRGVLAATLPREAGLSSSASLELAAAWALSGESAAWPDPLALARICQRAENAYVGVQSGLMDQFAVAAGAPDAALFLDCRSLSYRAVPLPLDQLALVVCFTGLRRRLGISAYNARRAQCADAVRTMASRRSGISSLRDLEPHDLAWAATVLDAETFRRVRHVVTENARVRATVEALEAVDLDALTRLFAESHASLRDDYEVSSPALDLLVEIAAAVPGVVASRMTGAGFGGCTVNLVRPDAIPDLGAAVAREYPSRSGLTPTLSAVKAVRGAGMLPPRSNDS